MANKKIVFLGFHNYLANISEICEYLIREDFSIINPVEFSQIVKYFGIEFEIVVESNAERLVTLANATREVKKEFSRLRDIGEPLFITDVYTALKKTTGVLDVIKVDIVPKVGTLYSDYTINISQNLSPDGRYVIIPDDSIFEIKFPDLDIKGTIK